MILDHGLVTWFFKKYLFSQRSSSLVRRTARLAMISQVLGVASWVIVLGIMNGFHGSIGERMLKSEPHLVVFDLAHKLSRQELTGWLKGFEVQSISRFETQDVLVRTLEGVFGGAVAKGVEWEVLESLLKQNSLSRSATDKLLPGEMLVGADLAQNLGIFLGDEILVLPPESLILGPGEVPTSERATVYEALSSGVSRIDTQMIFYELGKSLQGLGKTRSHQAGFEIRFADARTALTLVDSLRAKTDTKILRWETWGERHRALLFALKLEKWMMSVFLGISTLITCFALFTTLSLLIIQKRRELGVLKALGFSDFQVRTLFFRIGMGIAARGVGGGLVIGTGVVAFLENFPLRIMPAIYYDSTLPAELSFQSMLIVAGFSVGVVMLAISLSLGSSLKLPAAQLLR